MTFEEYVRWIIFLPVLDYDTEDAMTKYKAQAPEMEDHWQGDMEEYDPHICAAFVLDAKIFLIHYRWEKGA